jgi:serine phosphatase RsbU (regulator of sigma subunit)
MSRYRSFLAVPMTTGPVITGFLLFARGPAAPPFSTDDAGQVAGLAARAAGCIASACLVIGQQQRATGAQRRRLIPAAPPAPAGIEVAARCLPAPGQVSGGDWYDIIALPGGRAGLITGDAMGHDQHAAAAMAQLRAAAHALAELGLPPADVLRRLDRTTAALGIVTFATCIYAVIDPASRRCVMARAGHLPPVIALPDGTTSAPDLPSGLPIGLGTAIYGQITLPLPPGATLALYTDGLVDTRTRSSDQGILALRAALAGQHGPLEHACGELVRSLAPHPEDDTTLVLARIPPGRGPLPRPPVQL